MIYSKGKKRKTTKTKKYNRVIIVTVFLTLLSFVGTLLSGGLPTTSTNTDTKKPSASTQQQAGNDVAIQDSQPITTPAPAAPASSSQLYVLPSSAPMRAANSASGDQKNKLTTIANTPMGFWQTKSSSITTYTQTLQDAYTKSQVPIVVLYNIPKIGCGSAGAASLDAYKTWVQARASAITKTTIVVLEPDAVAMLSCLNDTDKVVRIQALQYAAAELAKTPAVTYIDAGHSSWVSAATMSERIKQIGMNHIRGISVNVSNYQTNSDSAAYAQKIVNELGGGYGIVIDTSRNGVGAPADKQWCNASGRKLGTPSTFVNSGGIDAYLWVKVPGESDGTCNGGPNEGQWWLDYALGLAS